MEVGKSNDNEALGLLKSSKLVMWDFDGVIKDSVSVKGTIFADIFPGAAPQVRKKILDHHNRNGGLSRYKKIPLYMRWCGIPETEKNISDHIAMFSSQSIQRVVDSPWIEGALNHLRHYSRLQKFYLVSATPIDELMQITMRLNIDNCFLGIFGFPTSKKEAILTILTQERASPTDAIFIGDSLIDYESASACGVPFIFRGQPSASIVPSYRISDFQ